MIKLNTIQKREKLNDVYTEGKQGNGGAYHIYMVTPIEKPYDVIGIVDFQNGPRNAEGSTSGVLDSDLLEIARHRLQCFQAGEFATEYNAKALEHIEIALMYMNRRVEDRIERNVLGTYKK